MRDYEAYLFDLYGTLVDIHTDESRPGLWREMAAWYTAHGAAWRGKDLHRAYLQYCAEETAAREKSSPYTWIEIDIGRVFDRLFAARGVTASAALTGETAWHFRRLSTTRLRTYAGAADLLQALQNKGRKVILLSNAQRLFTRPELTKLGLTDLFDGIFLSSEAGCRKPDMAFFRLPLERFGIEPEHCLMIGNDPVCDIAGARTAGMDTWFIRSALSPKGTDCSDTTFRQEGMDLDRVKRKLLEKKKGG